MRRFFTALAALGLLAQMNTSQPSPVNHTQINGAAVVTAASGVQKVGISDSSGATLTALNGALEHVHVASTNSAAALTSKTVAALSVQNLKASAGNVYGASLQNTNSSACWLQFFNTSGTPTLGTGVIFSIAVPASSALTLSPGSLALTNFSTGIGVGSATTAAGSTACGTALAGTIFYQ